MKKKFFLFLPLIFLFLLPLVSLAIEVRYPYLPVGPGETSAPTQGIDLPPYIRYIFYFFVAVSGFIALGAMLYGGFLYFTSAGSAERTKKGKDHIFAAILGLVLLFFTYLILVTINPNFLSPQSIIVPPSYSDLSSGVYLCKNDNTAEINELWDGFSAYKKYSEAFSEAKMSNKTIAIQDSIRNEMVSLVNKLSADHAKIAQNCYRAATTGEIPPAFNNLVTNVYIYPVREFDFVSPSAALYSVITNYGFVLYENNDFNDSKNKDKLIKAPVQIEYKHLTVSTAGIYEKTTSFSVKAGLKPSSIKIFKLNYIGNPNIKATLYENIQYDELVITEHTPQVLRISNGYWASYNLAFDPQSIRIDSGLIVILEASIDETDEELKNADVFFTDDPNLNDNSQISKEYECPTAPPDKLCRRSVANQAIIIAADPL